MVDATQQRGCHQRLSAQLIDIRPRMLECFRVVKTTDIVGFYPPVLQLTNLTLRADATSPRSARSEIALEFFLHV